jgi:hypothetical protein
MRTIIFAAMGIFAGSICGAWSGRITGRRLGFALGVKRWGRSAGFGWMTKDFLIFATFLRKKKAGLGNSPVPFQNLLAFFRDSRQSIILDKSAPLQRTKARHNAQPTLIVFLFRLLVVAVKVGAEFHFDFNPAMAAESGDGFQESKLFGCHDWPPRFHRYGFSVDSNSTPFFSA